MAPDMNNSDLLCKISNTDLLALESQYHFRYLTAHRNKHRFPMRSNSRTENVIHKQIRANVLVEVYEYIESELDDTKYIFYKKDLRLVYEQTTLQFAIDLTIKVEFRSKIMNYFEF